MTKQLTYKGYSATVGHGLALIKQEMARLESPPPIFAAAGQNFRVTMPSRHVEFDALRH